MIDDPRRHGPPGPGSSPAPAAPLTPAEHQAQRLARDLALMARYPDLFGAPVRGLMAEGWRMEEGWVPLVTALLDDIRAAVRATEGSRVRILFVGQKFGGLRVQVAPHVPAVAEAIERAEARAWHTCEHCGASGRLRTARPFVQVLCDAHEAEAEQEARLRRTRGW